MIGIYKITSPNNRVYIGQSVNINKRFYRYSILSANVKGQTKLYRSFLKYGVLNHKFEILKECSQSELNELERYYQEYYNSVDDGLNCVYTKTSDKSGSPSKETLHRMSIAQKGNKHWLGKNHTQESKDKISKAHKGRKHSDETNLLKGRKGRESNRKGFFSDLHPRSKKVVQLDRENNIVKEWICIRDIVRELNYSAGNISSCCNGKMKTYKNYLWKFK
jgi:group I intron endonuclease